jgi:hypothetical protein
MLDISVRIRDCHRHAQYCARQAAAQADAGLKLNSRDAQRRWLKLAATYKSSKRLQQLTTRTHAA